MACAERTRNDPYEVLIGIFVLSFVISGYLNAFSLYLPEIVKSGYDLKAVSSFFTCQGITTAVGNFFLRILIQKIEIKKTMLLGCICAILTFVVIYGAKMTVMFCCAGLLSGFGWSFSTFAAIDILITRWFKEKRNTMVSIAFMAPSLGGSILSMIIAKSIDMFGWRYACLINCCVISLTCIPAALLLIQSKPEGYEESEKKEVCTEKRKRRSTANAHVRSYYLAVVIMMFAFALIGFSGSGGWTYIPMKMQSEGLSVTDSGNMVAFAQLVGSGFILLAGYLADRMDKRILALLLASVSALGNHLIGIAGQNMGFHYFANAVRSLGGVVKNQGPSLFVLSTFGKENNERLIGKMQAMVSLGSMLCTPVLSGIIIEHGFVVMYDFIACCVLFGGLLLLTSFFLIRWKKNDEMKRYQI